MPSGPFVKELQGVADASNVLAPPQRAIVAGDGLAVEDAPNVVLTGNGQSITGATRIKLGGAVTVAADGVVYRYDSGGNIATIGKASGLTRFRVRNVAGDGYALELDNTGACNLGDGLNANGFVVSGAGLVLSGALTHADAATYASALSEGWLFYECSEDDGLFAVSKAGQVVLLGAPDGGEQRGTVQTTTNAITALSPPIAIPMSAQTGTMTIRVSADNTTDGTQQESCASFAYDRVNAPNAPSGTPVMLSEYITAGSPVSIGMLVDLSYSAGKVLVKAKGVSGKVINWRITASVKA